MPAEVACCRQKTHRLLAGCDKLSPGGGGASRKGLTIALPRFATPAIDTAAPHAQFTRSPWRPPRSSIPARC
ncbi:conserved hypothetical protein [Novosphingobium sp. 9U]|nr:conserved hypothetical protein [Novosphingobium sp. 9U]